MNVYGGFEAEQATVAYHKKRIEMLGVDEYERHAALMTGAARIAAHSAIDDYRKAQDIQRREQAYWQLQQDMQALLQREQGAMQALEQKEQAMHEEIRRAQHAADDARQLAKTAVFIAAVAIVIGLWVSVTG